MGSADYFGESHLDFLELPLEKGKKTHTYDVVNTKFDEVIGKIHWRGGWRQYVFQALNHNAAEEDIKEINGIKYIPMDYLLEIDMSRSCMKEVNDFIDKLMKEWKDSRKHEKDSNNRQ